MRILFVAGMDITIPPNHRAHHFISFLERLGVQVDVVRLIPFYTSAQPVSALTRFRHGLSDSMHRPCEISQGKTGMQIAIRTLPGRLDAFVQRFWVYLHLRPIITERYDYCIFGSPDNVLLPLLLKKRGLIKTVIYDDWDFYPGFNRSWLWNHMTRYREHLCVTHSDMVISVGALLARLRKSQGATRSLVIPNGVNYPLFATAQAKKPHPPTLMYMGRLGADWGIDVSIEGFAQVHKHMPEARYLIVGYDVESYRIYLQNLIHQLRLDDCVFLLGRKRYEELPNYLAEADIGVALHKPNDLMKYAFPLKVVEYMAAGLAVVGSRVGETESLILENESGRCIDYSPAAFADTVLEILGDGAVLARYRDRAQENARRYDWNSVFSGLADLLGLPGPVESAGI